MYVGDGKMIEAEMTGTLVHVVPVRLGYGFFGLGRRGASRVRVPTSFHLGPLVFHTYGFGLAIAAYVCYLYARRRLSKVDFSVEPFGKFTLSLIVAGLLGARLANIATNWGYYSGHPARWIAVWQGGLASFGGIALALPVGLYFQRRWWPESSLAGFTDALVPALIAGWALDGCSDPVYGERGGHLTHQWFGLHYAGEVGKRVPSRSSKASRTPSCGSRCSASNTFVRSVESASSPGSR